MSNEEVTLEISPIFEWLGSTKKFALVSSCGDDFYHETNIWIEFPSAFSIDGPVLNFGEYISVQGVDFR